MRRSPSRRLLCAALLAMAVWAPTAAAPAAAVDVPDNARPHNNDCSSDGLGRKLTARLDKTIDDVAPKAGIPGVVVGLWMPGKGCYVRAKGWPTRTPANPCPPTPSSGSAARPRPSP